MNPLVHRVEWPDVLRLVTRAGRQESPVADVDRNWVGRLLGVGWLVGAFVLLLGAADLPHTSTMMWLAGFVGVVGVALAWGWPAVASPRMFDVVLLASTSATGAVALGLPEARQTIAACMVWAVPFAYAALPPRHALVHVAYVVLVDAVVMAVSTLSGHVAAAAATVHWLLVTATVVSVAMVILLSSDHLHRRTLVAEAVAELGHRALGITDTDELLRQALRCAVAAVGADYGTALRRLPEGQLRVAAELGPDPIAPGTILMLAETNSYALRVLDSGKPFVAADLRADLRVSPPRLLLSRGVVSGLAVPVVGAHESLGVLALHLRRPHHFGRAEVAAATALAGVVATAWEQAAQRQTIEHMAMHDSLTGLPNRSAFLDRLERALVRRPDGSLPQGAIAVVLFDLDDFKSVNDGHGHHAGDELLAEVGGRFSGAVRPQDTVARLGGDEFAMLCEQTPDEHAAARLVHRVQAVLAEPITFGEVPVRVSASAGIALGRLPTDRQVSAVTLLQEADTALYAAKRDGRGASRLFDEHLQAQVRARLQLERELRHGIERGEFELHYQAVRSAQDRRVLGVEALVRWRHPRRGLLPPAEFMPVAEESGLVVPLGRWVLDTACAQAARWQRPGGSAPWVAVNVSPRQLGDPELPGRVADALRHNGLGEGALWLEVTETALLEDGAAAEAALTTLRGTGVRLVLDDFGTGYSSLTHLTRFPIDALKIDRSFVAGLGRNHGAAAVVSAVIALGLELQVQVIAEGVEEPQQLAMLAAAGCFGVQGFLLDRPAPPSSLDLAPPVRTTSG